LALGLAITNAALAGNILAAMGGEAITTIGAMQPKPSRGRPGICRALAAEYLLGIVRAFDMATRYKIVFQSLDYLKHISDYKRFDYTICTCLDERKAIVMAAWHHITKFPDSRIYQVESVEQLAGTEAEKTDIVDRMEY
jgi:hypothetical protein